MMPTRGSIAALPDDLPVRILDGSPDAILICDHAGTVRYWNAAAERVFGFRVTDALGVSMNLIIPERFRARHWAGWEATMRTGVTRYGEGQWLAVPALHKDGRKVSIEFLHPARKGRRRPNRVGSSGHPRRNGAFHPREGPSRPMKK
jgi:PAS domain S-box-containing protein